MKLKSDFGVRALIATIIIAGATFAGVWLVITGSAELGMGFLGNAALAALGFYFGQRSKT